MIRFCFLYLAYLFYRFRLWRRVRFHGFTVVYAFRGSSIRWGKNIEINSSSLSNLSGLHQRTILVARDGGRIDLGDCIGLSGVTIYSVRHISIGSHTLIGANSIVMDNDFHPLDAFSRRRNLRSAIVSREVRIGQDCFIGMNSIICKGTVMGDRCVVGAGSVVCGCFPSDCILAGNPARIIRRNHPEERLKE